MKLVLASANAGKIDELGRMLEPHGLTLIGQQALGIDAAEESAPSFVENALLKARHVARHAGLPTIADDSGIAVDALDGAPGVYSARYAGVHGDDRANNERLLAALAARPPEERGAAFHCVIVLLRHADDPTPVICHGEWRGRIALAPRGNLGFGYDPLFEDPTLGRTAAELTPSEKDLRSHRGQALRSLLDHLARAPTGG